MKKNFTSCYIFYYHTYSVHSYIQCKYTCVFIKHNRCLSALPSNKKTLSRKVGGGKRCYRWSNILRILTCKCLYCDLVQNHNCSDKMSEDRNSCISMNHSAILWDKLRTKIQKIQPTEKEVLLSLSNPKNN